MKTKKEYQTQNSKEITSGDIYFPLSENSGPSDLERRDEFPLKNFKVENTSGNQITVLIDPRGTESHLQFTVPNGQTLASTPEEDWCIYNLAIINNGSTTIAVDSIKTNVRNY